MQDGVRSYVYAGDDPVAQTSARWFQEASASECMARCQ